MKHSTMINRTVTVATVAALPALAPLVAHAAGTQQETSAAPSLWPLILAMLAAAFAIERVLELLWNYTEWLLLNSKRMTVTTLVSSAYVKFKSGTSVLLGAIFGVLLAGLFTFHLFAALQPLTLGFLSGVPANWDVALSGIIVGVLAKPVHDLIGVIAGLKGFLSGAAVHQREAAGAAMADGVLKLAQSEAQGMIEVPGMGPTRIAGAYGQDEDGKESTADEKSATDRYIEILHYRTAS
ncbi:MAG: hypothetical protein KDE45_23210 [Caldilineaceae bacterium]|nr:hypothetical protein [Caldilineaceae bacterium]